MRDDPVWTLMFLGLLGALACLLLALFALLVRKAFWGRRRVSGGSPMADLPCDWCGEVKPTTVNEVWSNAFPEGRLRRLCDDCCSSCAGG